MPILSINLTATQAQRMATALGAVMGLGRDATPEEARQYWISEMRRLVKDVEHRVAAEQIPISSFDPT